MVCGLYDDYREELSFLDGREVLPANKPLTDYKFSDDLSWLIQGPSVDTCALIVKDQESFSIAVLWVYLHKMIQEASVV